MPLSRILLSALCVCGFAAAGQAASTQLNVKPGLWQMTSSGESQGVPSIPAGLLAKLPPAQRAKMAAAMAHAMGQTAKPHVYKYCVTAKSLQRGFNPDEHPADTHCTPKIVARSATMMDMREACSGRHGHTTGHFHFEAPNPETMNGTIDLTLNDGGHTMHIKRVMRAQWLGADCGKYAHND